MSMLGEQIKELREKADMLDGLEGMDNLVRILREAADTIESLRDSLQAVNDGCEYCKGGDGFDGQKVMMSNHGWQTINCCPNCGKRCVHRG